MYDSRLISSLHERKSHFFHLRCSHSQSVLRPKVIVEWVEPVTPDTCAKRSSPWYSPVDMPISR